MYKYLFCLLVLIYLNACRTTYYEKKLVITPVNESNRKKVSDDVNDICINNGLKLMHKAFQNYAALYNKDNLNVFYDPLKMEISVRSYSKRELSKMVKLLDDALNKNKSINIKSNDSIYYSSRFF